MSSKKPYNCNISALGHYVPEKVIDNKYFENYLDTTDEWITERTGIKERRYLEKDQPTSYAATKAVEELLKNRNMSPDEIELIVLTTVTPDMIYPSTACIIQNNIGAKNCWGFDLIAACSGFIFALYTGAQFIKSGTHKKVIVCGADKMSLIADPDDRNNIVLFGDGAAAFLLEPGEDENYGIIDAVARIDGSGGRNLCQLAGGSLHPASHETVDKKMHFIYQDGRTVFKDAVKGMADVSLEIMKRNNLKSEDVAYLVPHQANHRIIAAIAGRMGVSMDKVMMNIHKYGNTTTASIPLCVYEYWADGKLKKDDNIILSSFGAGYTYGSIYVKWTL